MSYSSLWMRFRMIVGRAVHAIRDRIGVHGTPYGKSM
jgi:hypothetical protein